MKKNDVIELVIKDNGMNGEGVAIHDGIVVFIPFAITGEKVKVVVKDVKKKFATAQIIKVIEPSSFRIEPACPHYFKCGGCDMMHINYDAEVAIKTNEVEKNLTKIGGIVRKVDKFVDSDNNLYYRNKVQLPFGMHMGKVRIGYFMQNSHKFIPIDDCCLVGEWANDVVDKTLRFCNDRNISVYDELTHSGLLRHLVIRRVGGRVAVMLVINGNIMPSMTEFIELFSNDTSVYINTNQQKTNVIIGDKTVCVKGDNSLPCNIMGVKAKISPNSFLQINDYIRDMLYSDVTKYLDGAICVDLFSGIGITSNIIAKNCDKVYSVELGKEACDNALYVAKSNNNEAKIEIICGDATEEMPKLARKISGGATHYMELSDKWYSEIVIGNKKYEYRLLDDKRKKIKKGDAIVFNNIDNDKRVLSLVNEVVIAKDFVSLATQLNNNSKDLIIVDVDKFVNDMQEIYVDATQDSECVAFELGSISEYGLTNCQTNLTDSQSGLSNTDDSATSVTNDSIQEIHNKICVLVDPPRKGLDDKTIEAITTLNPRKIAYISCNHATLARDLKILNTLTNDAYYIETLNLYNMFPRTHHVETLVCLTRKN